jgi:hypothetical protein
MLQQQIIQALEAFGARTNGKRDQPVPTTRELKALIKQVRSAHLLEPSARYRCPECDTILEDGERRCGDCNKFGSRVDVLMECPHCSEPITGEE